MSEPLRNSAYPASSSIQQNPNLDDILKCVICYDKLLDPKMCPFCSKLCCRKCIHKWLMETRSQCPHCRSSLRLDQLVTCRFLNDITQVLENITSKQQESSEKCQTHNCPLNYFCSDCLIPLCSDCAMFSTEHKGHEFQHLANVYKQHVDHITSESKVLGKKIKELEGVLAELDGSIEKIRVAKEEKSRELVVCMENIQNRLDLQMKEKLQALGNNRDEVWEEIRNLKGLQTELDKELGQATKSKLISKSSDLVKRLKYIQSMPVRQLENASFDCEFHSEIMPVYDSGVFVLKNYSEVVGTVEVVYSDMLNINGLLWRLKVYPNGNGVAKGNYLSVFLELVKGYGESAKYDYRVEMINHANSNQCVIREFSSDFETGECWGYNRFFRIDLLRDEGYLGAEDTLTMKFSVRPPTYYQLHKDQANFIRILLEKEAASKRSIEELSLRLAKYGELVSEPPEDHSSKSSDNECKEESKADQIPKERKPNSPNELSTMIQKYMMSPEALSSDGEITPKHLNWNEMQDIPDFHSCSELMSQDFLDSPEGEDQEFSPLGENLIKALSSIQACLK